MGNTQKISYFFHNPCCRALKQFIFGDIKLLTWEKFQVSHQLLTIETAPDVTRLKCYLKRMIIRKAFFQQGYFTRNRFHEITVFPKVMKIPMVLEISIHVPAGKSPFDWITEDHYHFHLLIIRIYALRTDGIIDILGSTLKTKFSSVLIGNIREISPEIPLPASVIFLVIVKKTYFFCAGGQNRWMMREVIIKRSSPPFLDSYD